MKFKTKSITFCAMMAALSVVFMFIGNMFPTGRIGFMALASLFTVAVVIQYRYIPALFVFAVSTAIGFLILPDKAPLAFFGLFFGYYPIIKSIAEKTKNKLLEWAIKVAVFNAALTVLFVFLRELLMFSFFDKFSGSVLVIVIYITFNIVFVVYDIGLGRLIGFYMTNIYNKLR